MGTTHVWTPQAIETLRQLWEEGQNSDVIAAAVGVKSAKKMPYLKFLDADRALPFERSP